MKKSLGLAKVNGVIWIMSNWTGEIVRPWEVKKIFGMVRDFSLEPRF